MLIKLDISNSKARNDLNFVRCFQDAYNGLIFVLRHHVNDTLFPSSVLEWQKEISREFDVWSP